MIFEVEEWNMMIFGMTPPPKLVPVIIFPISINLDSLHVY